FFTSTSFDPPSGDYGGIQADYANSGFVNMVGAACFDPQGDYKSSGVSQIIVHEHTHDLFQERASDNIGHLIAMGKGGGSEAILNGENGVPSGDSLNGQPASRYYDYLLMGGNTPYGIYTKGALTMAVHERTILGWLDPIPLASDQLGVTARDLYTYGDAYQIAVGQRSSGDTRTLFVSNRQRLGYFDSLATFDYPGAAPNANDWSLMDNGIAIELSRYPDGDHGYYDFLFADNTFAGGSYSAAYQGDMHGPGGKTQITPWTVPNINGCAGYEPDVVCGQPDFVMTWQGLDNMRYQGGADSTMRFDFYTDYRNAPVVYIRSDSWMGAETDGSAFAGEVRVTNGATLTIEDGITLTFDEDLVVEAGARLEVGTGVDLRFASGKRLIVRGTLNAEGTTFAARDSIQGWGGVRFEPSSDGLLQDAIVQDVDVQGVTNRPAVFVHNADVVFEGVIIQDGSGDGLRATGAQADITMQPLGQTPSQILRHAATALAKYL
ncbi:MAG: hypothetical protein AAGN64_15650, partial [Bacteroidota bacterium]